MTYAQGNGPSTTINILEEALGNPAFPNRYTDMMNSLLVNPGFKSYFINRFADLMNEYWTPEKADGLINENAAEIATEINRQSARWGSPDSLQWRDEIHYLKEFHIVRRIYQRNQIEDYFGLNNQLKRASSTSILSFLKLIHGQVFTLMAIRSPSPPLPIQATLLTIGKTTYHSIHCRSDLPST